MEQIIEGVYRKGMIKLKKSLKINDDSNIKIKIIDFENDKNDSEANGFGTYSLGKDLDNINISDYAYEDWRKICYRYKYTDIIL